MSRTTLPRPESCTAPIQIPPGRPGQALKCLYQPRAELERRFSRQFVNCSPGMPAQKAHIVARPTKTSAEGIKLFGNESLINAPNPMPISRMLSHLPDKRAPAKSLDSKAAGPMRRGSAALLTCPPSNSFALDGGGGQIYRPVPSSSLSRGPIAKRYKKGSPAPSLFLTFFLVVLSSHSVPID